jgi:hypothetical protein
VQPYERSPGLAQHFHCPPPNGAARIKGTTCKFEFTFLNEADAADWMTAYLTGMGNTLSHTQYFMDGQPDGSMRVTMYGFR